jgi:AcrR family transcriptional regulator
MDAVAAEADVGKGTIFRRFDDRAGLAEALVDESVRELQERILRGPPRLGPGALAADRLEAFAVALVRFADGHLAVASWPRPPPISVIGSWRLRSRCCTCSCCCASCAAPRRRRGSPLPARGAITAVLAHARAQGTNVNTLPASIPALDCHGPPL